MWKRSLGSMIAVGDRLPEFTFQSIKPGPNGACSKPFAVTINHLFANKKAVLISVPGAFTPTCTSKHIPGFISGADKLKEKGVQVIACTAVNDAFVMGAWMSQLQADDRVQMLADGSGQFAKMIGSELDLTEKGMGVRGKRFAMILDDMIVKYIGVDDSGLEKSSIDAILSNL